MVVFLVDINELIGKYLVLCFCFCFSNREFTTTLTEHFEFFFKFFYKLLSSDNPQGKREGLTIKKVVSSKHHSNFM